MKHRNIFWRWSISIVFLGLLTGANVRAQVAATDTPDKPTMNETAGQENSVTLLQREKELAEKSFIGSWEGVLTAEDGGPPPFRILFTFGTDGTVVATDAGPPNPQLSSSEHGAWKYTGRREFLVTYKQLIFDQGGNLVNLFKARVRFRLNRFGNEISGPVIVDFYDADNNPLFSGAGKIKCTKIQAEPLN